MVTKLKQVGRSSSHGWLAGATPEAEAAGQEHLGGRGEQTAAETQMQVTRRRTSRTGVISKNRLSSTISTARSTWAGPG